MHQHFIPQPQPGLLDPASIIEQFALRMMYTIARDQYNATDLDAQRALAYSVRDRLMDRWFATQNTYYDQDVKRVYYLSLEFLLGRLLMSNIVNLGATGAYAEAMMKLGYSLEHLAECESDAGLGNGGLGRLAACFLDCASTLGIPFYGYGIRYEFGIFRQKIVDGEQTESPDPWLRYGNPWEVARPDVLFPVKFRGRSEYYKDPDGRERWRWVDTEDVYAMAYDVAAPGYANDTVNSLRLGAAKSSREFDLGRFNAGAYAAAVEDKTKSENISKVLYPTDDQYAGRELRLRQQFFFASASVQDILRHFKQYPQRKWSELPDKVAIQLNDTHPSVAIAEMLRILVDEEGLDWDRAWPLCERVFAYTNHTVLPEALEAWSIDLMRDMLPRHLQIIEEIDRRFRRRVVELTSDEQALKKMAIIGDGRVRMANLAVIGSHSVNGVARLHSTILAERVFPDFRALYPGKFSNKTNGISPRRWLLQANPDLSSLIDEGIGDRWHRDLAQLRGLERYVHDAAFRERWQGVKLKRKHKLTWWLRRVHGIGVDPASLFDVQIKRMHEYKRQLLNLMHVIALYHRVIDGEAIVPRTVIFGGKAAPGYFMAKLTIKLIHDVAAMIRDEIRCNGLLSVVFVPNYDVSAAELLFPATEISEQISTAGTEASGTGCMKAVMNGAVIVGTHDGANIEIGEEVGSDNIFLFGHGIAGHDLERVIAQLAAWDRYRPIVNAIRGADQYEHCADFGPYSAAQRRAAEAWTRNDCWTRISIYNTARSARFSADRTVAEYAREIWHVDPVVVRAMRPPPPAVQSGANSADSL
jgi:starch phosphorylase